MHRWLRTCNDICKVECCNIPPLALWVHAQYLLIGRGQHGPAGIPGLVPHALHREIGDEPGLRVDVNQEEPETLFVVVLVCFKNFTNEDCLKVGWTASKIFWATKHRADDIDCMLILKLGLPAAGASCFDLGESSACPWHALDSPQVEAQRAAEMRTG